MEVSLTTKADSLYAKSKSFDDVDLTRKYESFDADTVCRTCTLGNNRDWPHKLLVAQGKADFSAPTADQLCSPEKDLNAFKIVGTTNWREQRVALTEKSSHRTVAVVSNCGHTIQTKCKSCDRFAPEQVAIPYDPGGKGVYSGVEVRGESFVPTLYTGSGLPVRYWNTTVGGHCTIPSKGIIKNGEVTFCDPQPRKINIDNPSCHNCNWLEYMGSQWQTDYLEVNDHASLNAWERHQVTMAAEASNTPYGVIYNRYLEEKMTENIGRIMFFSARVLKKGMHNGQLKYKLQFVENNIVAVIAAHDERFYVHENHIPMDYNVDASEGDDVDPMVAVEIMYPNNTILRLPATRLVAYRLWPKFPEKEKVYADAEFFERRNENCSDCRQKMSGPCYFHAKAPVRHDTTREIEFTDPNARAFEFVVPAHGKMSIVERDGVFVAVDGNGNTPEAYATEKANATVFRQWLPTLIEKAYYAGGNAAVDQINKQYRDIVGTLVLHNRMRTAHVSWLHNVSTEPSKPSCTHPWGHDLRHVFGDSFGLERTDFDFDMGAATTMEVEEEIRVGWRQHEMTPQRLHEEILSTLTSHPRYDPASGSVPSLDVEMPEEFEVIKIEGLGGMVREDGTPVTDVNEFLERLDDKIAVGHLGESNHERLISRRQQLFGYDMTRGYYGSRRGSEKTPMGSMDNEMAIFDREEEDDDADLTSAWKCPDCHEEWNQSDIENFFDPLCPDCGASLWRNHMTREVMNPRRSGGLGNVLVKESGATLQRKRLQANLCPNWALKGAPHIGLDQIAGPVSETPVGIGKQVKKVEAVTIYKVGVITDEMRAHNAAYYAEVAKVEDARAEYLEKNPETSIEELIELFPTHAGSIYQPKAAGSLAKMGGV